MLILLQKPEKHLKNDKLLVDEFECIESQLKSNIVRVRKENDINRPEPVDEKEGDLFKDIVEIDGKLSELFFPSLTEKGENMTINVSSITDDTRNGIGNTVDFTESFIPPQSVSMHASHKNMKTKKTITFSDHEHRTSHRTTPRSLHRQRRTSSYFLSCFPSHYRFLQFQSNSFF